MTDSTGGVEAGQATGGKRPSDLAWPGSCVDDLCLTVDEGIYGEVQSASHPRASVIGRFASEAGCDFKDVRCAVRYLRLFTRQDVWDGPGKDRWVDEFESAMECSYEEARAACPVEAPADWMPDEYMPCWEFCDKSHPSALKAYVCEVRGHERVLTGAKS